MEPSPSGVWKLIESSTAVQESGSQIDICPSMDVCRRPLPPTPPGVLEDDGESCAVVAVGTLMSPAGMLTRTVAVGPET